MLPLAAAGIKDVLEHPKVEQTQVKGPTAPLASTGTPSVAQGRAVAQIPLTEIARRALILPREQGADFLAQSSTRKVRLAREMPARPVGLWLCHWFGTKPWEIEAVQHLPLVWEPGWVAAASSASYGP